MRTRSVSPALPRFALLIASLGLGPGAWAGPPGDAPKVSLDRWRNENACGVNCLYVMLGVNDVKQDYESLMGTLLAKAEETSLLDLKRAARAAGMPCETGRTTPELLASVPGPVICHWEDEASGRGHFVLALRAGKEGVDMMDGTSCVLRRVDWPTFRKTWTGYILYPTNPTANRPEAAGWILGGCALTWACLIVARRCYPGPRIAP